MCICTLLGVAAGRQQTMEIRGHCKIYLVFLPFCATLSPLAPANHERTIISATGLVLTRLFKSYYAQMEQLMDLRVTQIKGGLLVDETRSQGETESFSLVFQAFVILLAAALANEMSTENILEFSKQADDPSSLMTNPQFIIWSPVCRNNISWNFEKFLIGPEGVPFNRYSRHFKTIKIEADTELLLQKVAKNVKILKRN